MTALKPLILLTHGDTFLVPLTNTHKTKLQHKGGRDKRYNVVIQKNLQYKTKRNTALSQNFSYIINEVMVCRDDVRQALSVIHRTQKVECTK